MISYRGIAFKNFGKLLYPNLAHGNYIQRPSNQRCLKTEVSSIPDTKFHELHHDIKRNEHFDLVKDKLKSLEIHQQRPNAVRFIEYENMSAFNILKEKL